MIIEKNRLGYGGGFYDRYLKKYLRTNDNILTIGVAFSFQKYHKVPVSINDVKLDYILQRKVLFNEDTYIRGCNGIIR